MISNAYTLYDSKSLTYSPPFYAPAHGSAIRMVMELTNDLSTTVGRHPADFTLYCLGRFDDQSGQLLPSATREHISDVLALTPRPPAAAGLFEKSADGRDYFANPAVVNSDSMKSKS